MRSPASLAVVIVLAATAACSKSNNLLLGRVQANVGPHLVVVTDCYRTAVPPPETKVEANGQTTYRFMPCRDAEILIKADQLTVNGRSYGRIGATDGVLVDHGVVSVTKGT